MTDKTNRIAAKELLENVRSGFISNEFVPKAIWTERTFAQHNLETNFFYKTEKSYEEVHRHISKFVLERELSIYLNHIVLEFDIPDFGTIYMGINDGYLSISDNVATIGGKRIEL